MALVLEAITFRGAGIECPFADPHETMPVAEGEVIEPGRGRPVGRDRLCVVVFASEGHDATVRQADSQMAFGS